MENKNKNRNKYRHSNSMWGAFLLLCAAFVIINQLTGFVEIGVGSIIITVVVLVFIVQCIAQLSFAPLPIPVAVLYIIFQKPLGLPELGFWTLLFVALLATIGLSVLLPRKHNNSVIFRLKFLPGENHMHTEYASNDNYSDNGNYNNNDDNNPSVSVMMGAVSRYLHSNRLETARLNCNFGALEVFFNDVELSENGAEVHCECSFGAMEIFVPRHWNVINNINCSLGAVEFDKHFATSMESAPKIMLTGNVFLGAIEIRQV